MEKQMIERLQYILQKSDGDLTDHDLRFLRARSSYLTPEQIKRVNACIEAFGDSSLKKIFTKKVHHVEVVETEELDIVQNDDEDPELEIDGEKVEVESEEDNEDVVIVDEEEKHVSNPVDMDDMNIEQLREVAKQMGIRSPHLYKTRESLINKILEADKKVEASIL